MRPYPSAAPVHTVSCAGPAPRGCRGTGPGRDEVHLGGPCSRGLDQGVGGWCLLLLGLNHTGTRCALLTHLDWRSRPSMPASRAPRITAVAPVSVPAMMGRLGDLRICQGKVMNRCARYDLKSGAAVPSLAELGRSTFGRGGPGPSAARPADTFKYPAAAAAHESRQATYVGFGIRDSGTSELPTYRCYGLVDGSDSETSSRLQFASMGKPDEYKRGAWTTEASDDCCEIYRTLYIHYM